MAALGAWRFMVPAAVCFVYPFAFGRLRGVIRECVSTKRQNDGREPNPNVYRCLSMSSPEHGQGRAESAPVVRERNTTDRTLEPFFVLALPQSSVRLSHGCTHMGNLSDTTALVIQAPQVGKVVRNCRLNTCTKLVKIENALTGLCEPLFLHGLPTRKSFFVVLSTERIEFAEDRGISNASTNDTLCIRSGR